VEIVLRDFRHDDFETLWNIDQTCFIPGIAYSRRELSYYVRMPRAFTIVAESHPLNADELLQKTGGVAGFIVAHPSPKRIGHIITIDVLPAAQRLGVGSRLLAAAESRLREHKCHTAYLETAVDNVAALAFYKRHNYFLQKTIPSYYSNGVDACMMQKDLLSEAQAS
jgi:ribosomal protein S18 acetylase RimI-like enzyme